MKYQSDFVSIIALFGWGRHTDRLNSEYKPLTFGEIDQEVRKYAEYSTNFDAKRPDAVRLDYLVGPANGFELYAHHIDMWYKRDEGELFGQYILYKLTPR
jgi:hypothetical protein